MSTRINSSQLNIPQVTSDPISPYAGEIWALKTDYTGQSIGLLLSLTYTGLVNYKLSYKSSDGIILRQSLV